ncbi:MAG: hypothetical protein H0V30_03065 [Chitinophagaceae bacterium]|nr:hypothetical protein [Chitinophagaceae bacterium]
MYTKIIFIALVLLATSFKSNSVSNKNMVFNFNAIEAPVAQQESVPFVNWNPFVPTLADNVNNHHPDEDGKHHQFHFERLSRMRRGGKICCAICKFIILIMHISLLILLSGLFHA